MADKINCFISYCYDKIDRAALDFFVKQLKDKRIFTDLHIHYDLEDHKIRNWDEYIEKIKSSHVVIVICTPNYKQKTINHSDGVHKEYNQIIDKYNKAKQDAKNLIDENADKLTNSDIPNFDLIPIIIQGTNETSVPNIILQESIKYHDLSFFNILSKKEKGNTKYEVTKSQKYSYDSEIRKIKARIDSVKRFNMGGYLEKYLETWKNLKIDALFKQTKADFNSPDNLNENYHNSLFVKTYSYRQAASQAKYIFIGRKGSGKSALLQVTSLKMKNRFSFVIPIDRSKMDIIGIHNIFNDEIKSDSRYLSKRSQIFSYAWRLFFRIQLIESIITQYYQLSKQVKVKDIFSNEIETILIPLLEKIVNNNWIDYIASHPEREKRNHYFIYSISATINYFSQCIKNARSEPEYFYTDIESRFNYIELLIFTFGTEVSNLIESIVKHKRKNILITFDDADSYFNSQCYSKSDSDSLHMFELDFLYGLLCLVNNFKQLKQGDNLAPYFDFIVTISSEHLFEILKIDRDSYRLIEYYSVISWTGIELALMLRKRLATAYNFQITKSSKTSVKDTLNEILYKKLKFLPPIIKFNLDDGSRHEMHIFLYILRFTFWRPRDLLRYFAKIIVYAHDNYGLNTQLDSEMVRLIVKKSTNDIIESEFINEYRGYINNIRDLINCFEGCDQIFQFDEIERRIGNIEFILTLDFHNVESIIERIKHLYQIGFIGIYATLDMQNAYNLKSDTAFLFTEGADIINTLSEYNKKSFFYTIHPIFQSFLHLKMDSKRLLSNYSWEYLKEMEELMTSANHSYVVKF